jgi:hypothetical protein
MSGFTPSALPVINALASEFAVMDRFFSSHPGPTWPNRMFTLSGTSAGSTATFAWYRDVNGALFPQKTIFDQLEENGHTWRNYYNDTPWELFMEKIANSPKNLQSMDEFYAAAAQGTLPSFSWINPRSGVNVTTGVGSNDQHPDHDMNAGEQFYKDIYEALRASPSWNETLFIITYDEHGGFYDHVIPPEGVPAPGDGEQSYPDEFSFTRLGVRIPTLLISPWIRRGTVISAAPSEYKPYSNSEYDLTSIIATTRKLLGMPATPLTARDEWAATFEFVIDSSMTEPRTDCPMHLPDAVPPVIPASAEIDLPLNTLQRDIMTVHARLAGVAVPELEKQGDHSELVQKHYAVHKEKTEHFLSHVSSKQYIVVTKPVPLFGSTDETKWDLNGIKHGGNDVYANTTAPYITLSTMHLRTATEGSSEPVPLCLDGGDGYEGSVIGVTPCLPSIDPAINRAPSQHFVYPGDGTLRFYDSSKASHPESFLCVTSSDPKYDGTASVSPTYATLLKTCDHTVEQSWAYHGSAPGQSREGQLFYGDWACAMGVIPA